MGNFLYPSLKAAQSPGYSASKSCPSLSTVSSSFHKELTIAFLINEKGLFSLGVNDIIPNQDILP